MRAWMKIPNLEKEARAYIIKVVKLAASPLGCRVFCFAALAYFFPHNTCINRKVRYYFIVAPTCCSISTANTHLMKEVNLHNEMGSRKPKRNNRPITRQFLSQYGFNQWVAFLLV